MKRNALILFFATFTFLAFGDVANVRRSLAAEPQNPSAQTDVDTDANVAQQEFTSLAKDGALRTRAAFYPTELAFGDVGYFATFERNVGDETFSAYAPFEFELAKYIDLGAITITSPDVPGRYEIAPELATRRFFVKKIGFRLRDFPPGVERRKVPSRLNFRRSKIGTRRFGRAFATSCPVKTPSSCDSASNLPAPKPIILSASTKHSKRRSFLNAVRKTN